MNLLFNIKLTFNKSVKILIFLKELGNDINYCNSSPVYLKNKKYTRYSILALAVNLINKKASIIQCFA